MIKAACMIILAGITLICVFQQCLFASDNQTTKNNFKGPPRFQDKGSEYTVGPSHFLSQEEKDKTLCTSDEEIYFSCMFPNKKTISVCGTRDLALNKGYIKYRFGKSRKAIELEYPATTLTPKEAFKYYGDSYTKGHSTQLEFNIGGYKYIIYVESHVFLLSGSGIIVKRGGNKVHQMKCVENTIIDDLDYFSVLELATIEEPEEPFIEEYKIGK